MDYIVQYDPPDDPRDYIHRVGRTARAGKVGKSLLFLLESELGFLRYLKEAKVPLNEFVFPADRIENVQAQLENLLSKNYNLYRSATAGFRAYLQSYASYSLKKIFDVNALDLAKIAKAFGFKVPPRVNLAIGPGKGTSARAGEKRRRDEDTVSESEDGEGAEAKKVKAKAAGQSVDGGVSEPKRGDGGRARRVETVGQKAVDKERFRKAKPGANWSR